MIVIVSKADPSALKVVRHLDPDCKVIRESGKKVFVETNLQGYKSVAVYTLPHALMPAKKESKPDKKLTVSLYTEPPKTLLASFLTYLSGLSGRKSAKRASVLSRQAKRPKELNGCEIFVLVDRDNMTNADFRSLRSQLLQLTRVSVPSGFEHSGGAVSFNMLGGPKLVLTKQNIPIMLRPNRAYSQITGINNPVVVYGATDLMNTFEFLQTLKAGQVLGLPVAFETHPNAHNWRYWLNGFLKPSLALLNARVPVALFGLHPDAKYTAQVSQENVRNDLLALGMKNVLGDATSWAQDNPPLWKFYHRAAIALGREVLSLLGVRVEFAMVNFNDLLRKSEFWNVSATTFARAVYQSARHDVVLLNTPNGSQLRTNSAGIPNSTISELYGSGYHLGGAGVHQVIYSLGRYGGLVVLIKDSKTGLVNLIAKGYLNDPKSQLFVSPVGLFRMPAVGQSEDWSIDPIVFLELIRRWGKTKARSELKKVWAAMEVPLRPENIGKKTIAFVSAEGVQIK